jgi:hypothetical protein
MPTSAKAREHFRAERRINSIFWPYAKFTVAWGNAAGAVWCRDVLPGRQDVLTYTSSSIGRPFSTM